MKVTIERRMVERRFIAVLLFVETDAVDTHPALETASCYLRAHHPVEKSVDH